MKLILMKYYDKKLRTLSKKVENILSKLNHLIKILILHNQLLNNLIITMIITTKINKYIANKIMITY